MLCQCDCGNQKDVLAYDLLGGVTRSCGCLKRELAQERYTDDITGKTFNELTAVRRIEDFITKSGEPYRQWLFRCSCGREVKALAMNVKRGFTKSCGHIGKSYAEHKIFDLLQKNNIRFDYNYSLSPDLINPETGHVLYVDFKIYKTDGSYFVIEHQGIQHFYTNDNEFGKMQREVTDEIKREYCEANGIKLYETLYNEDYMSRVKEILKENDITIMDDEDSSSNG